MKSYFYLCMCLFLAISGSLSAQSIQQGTKDVQRPSMTFDKRLVDFGKVKKGEQRSTFFEFTNTSDIALEIDLVSGCECTTTDYYPAKPIPPGGKGRVDVFFDSTEKEESETVDVDIYFTNTDPRTGGPLLEIVQFKFELIE